MTTSEKNQGVIILLENEKAIRDAFEIAFEDHEIDLDLVQCETPEEYEVALKKAKEENNLRGLIIDLSNTSTEEDSRVYKASEYIQEEFDHNRIPIFIHSGNLEHYTGLKDKGTVFRTPKSAKSIEGISVSLKKMQNSGFLHIFCLGGELESRIMREIHIAFVSQFKDKEIEGIIDSIEKSCEPENLIRRTHEVFERIAIRTVFENLVSASKLEDGNIKEVQLNSIEHYYRRTSDFDFWTGDIFKAKDGNNRCVIITPRCNIGHKNYDELLLCKVEDISEQNLKELTGRKGEERLRKNITDHQIVGERYRFLPPTPQFSGGLVDFKANFTMNEDKFKELYEIDLTLSDELTNDVVRKYASYVLRGGISETEFREAHHYVKLLLPEGNK